MLLLGIICIIIGAILGIGILVVLGVVLAVIGLVLEVMGNSYSLRGRYGGRRGL